MARNKREQDRDSKRAEIIAAARLHFLENGFEPTSMSRLAASASIAPNTIYWYFKDKDDVLVAVLDAELQEQLAVFQQASWSNLTEPILWLVNQLERVSHLVSTVHARQGQSATIHAWHARFHALSEGLFRLHLAKRGWPPERIEAWVRIGVFSIEGLLSHPVSPEEKRRICAVLAGES